MISFQVNVYPGFAKPAWVVKDPDDLAEQNQADSVRIILERFARQAITPEQLQRAAFADSFDDGEDLHGDRISNLLEQPDLSGMSEVEMHEFLDSNTELKRVSDFNKSKEPTPDNPGKSTDSQETSTEPQPAD